MLVLICVGQNPDRPHSDGQNGAGTIRVGPGRVRQSGAGPGQKFKMPFLMLHRDRHLIRG